MIQELQDMLSQGLGSVQGRELMEGNKGGFILGDPPCQDQVNSGTISGMSGD